MLKSSLDLQQVQLVNCKRQCQLPMHKSKADHSDNLKPNKPEAEERLGRGYCLLRAQHDQQALWTKLLAPLVLELENRATTMTLSSASYVSAHCQSGNCFGQKSSLSVEVNKILDTGTLQPADENVLKPASGSTP